MSSLSRWSVNFLFLILALVTTTAQAQTGTGQPGQGTKTSIIIERQAIRFITPGEALEWRLVVANQQEEVIFDSGLVYGSTLDWPLKNQQGEAVSSGLYTYTLTTKAVTEETTRTQRGHLMLARPSHTERIWVTNDQRANIGAESPEVKLTVVGAGQITVGGAELPGGVPRREVSEERGELPKRDAAGKASQSEKEARLAIAGTPNKVAKFAADGSSLIDSTITETGSNIGIGTTNPLSILDVSSGNPLPRVTLTNPNSFGALHFYEGGSLLSGFQLIETNFPTVARRVDMEFFTAGGGDITFAPGNAGNTVEFKANGNVGIGTTNPTSRLEIAAQDGLAITGFNPFLTLRDTANSNKRSFIQGANGDLVFIPQSFSPGGAAMVIKDNSGNVGIGTTNPTAAKLQVSDTSVGTAVYGVTSTIGSGVFGESTNGNGYGVYGKNTSGGFAMFAEGHAGQSRNKGGWVKAMLYVNADGTIARCYNGITGSVGGNCGFTVEHPGAGNYRINFGFQVSDRFISITPGWTGVKMGANIAIFPSANEVDILTFITNASAGGFTDTTFMIIVY